MRFDIYTTSPGQSSTYIILSPESSVIVSMEIFHICSKVFYRHAHCSHFWRTGTVWLTICCLIIRMYVQTYLLNKRGVYNLLLYVPQIRYSHAYIRHGETTKILMYGSVKAEMHVFILHMTHKFVTAMPTSVTDRPQKS